MIEDKLKDKLMNRDENNVNFHHLIEFMHDSEANFIDKRLKGPAAMSLLGGDIIINMEYLDDSHTNKSVMFIILHENCHNKRIKKMGKEWHITNLSNENFDEFCEYIINEEIIADRYGRLLYYHFNKEHFPVYLTQQLENKKQQENYKQIARYLFGIVKNKEKNYNELMNNFIEN